MLKAKLHNNIKTNLPSGGLDHQIVKIKLIFLKVQVRLAEVIILNNVPEKP